MTKVPYIVDILFTTDHVHCRLSAASDPALRSPRDLATSHPRYRHKIVAKHVNSHFVWNIFLSTALNKSTISVLWKDREVECPLTTGESGSCRGANLRWMDGTQMFQVCRAPFLHRSSHYSSA